MPQRKIWTEEEDKILKFLKEERGERKWANIARLMEFEFCVKGRTGKQCRQRYHNHLDSSIINTEWTQQEEDVLYSMHEQIGNKWSAISQNLPGRSDNCVKNHFYSKLRKSIRKLNKIIVDYFDKEYHQIKEKILSKIIETQETKFKVSSKVDEELADFCKSIKNRLFTFESGEEEIDQDILEEARKLIVDIEMFQNNYKKGYKAIKKNEYELQCKSYLMPPKSSIRRSNSVSSDRSDDSSFLSSNSYISSCSDLSEYDMICQDNKKSKTTGSAQGSTGRNSDIIKGEKLSELKNVARSEFYYNCGEGDANEMNAEQLQAYHQDLVMEENNQNEGPFGQYFSNMIYDDTPYGARILGPQMDEAQFQLFPRGNQSDNEESIEFKQEKDQQN